LHHLTSSGVLSLFTAVRDYRIILGFSSQPISSLLVSPMRHGGNPGSGYNGGIGMDGVKMPGVLRVVWIASRP
jgi:hypothetical protein